MTATATEPKPPIDIGVVLDPAQREFINDDARVQVVCWHRQKGKDFSAACKAVFDALKTGDTWYIVSLTQRQADQTFEKCRWWAKKVSQIVEEIRAESSPQVDVATGLDITFNARELRLPGGGRVVSLPGRDPDALAGFTGNVIFTEFGLFPEGGYRHWRVVFPLATRGFQVIAISTPRGRNTKFFELVNDPETYSVHRCDIHRSLAEGFVLKDNKGESTDLETFKRLYGDEAGFRREYELEFTGDLDALLSWAKLQRAGELGRKHPFDLLEVTGEAGWRSNFFESIAPESGRLEIGWDVARKGDISALWVNTASSRAADTRRLRALVLMRRVSFELQRQIVSSAMRSPVVAVGCGDATGLGMDSNETLSNRFGSRWEGVSFSARTKSDLASKLLTTFDAGEQAIPPVDGPHKFIATDLYALQREEVGGQADKRLRLIESDNPLLPDSHCDVAYAGALALRAASLQGAQPAIVWV
ncbi:MAG: hypothetical protein AAF078_00270 [Planctomycetota bacterium]